MRRAVAQLFGGGLLSKVVGLGREVLVAALFGTGQAIGAYRVAQTGTSVPVNFFVSDSLNSAFIPLYNRLRVDSKDRAQMLFWALMVLFGVLSVTIALGLWGVAAPWVRTLGPGLAPETAAMASRMLRIMALGVPFYLFSALLTFLAMANGDFFPMASRATAQNVGLIVGAAAAYVDQDAMLFAWGFTASSAVFSLWVLIRASRAGFLAMPRLWNWPATGQVLRAFWATVKPLLLLPVMLQGNIAVERAVASVIGLVAVSALDYARFVTETLILLISVPVAFAGLSHWSGLDAEVVRDRLRKTVVLLLIVAVPASSFLAMHARQVVDVLYGRGAFDVGSAETTSEILFGLSFGLWAQVLGYVLIKGLNAQLRSRAVLWVMAPALIANAAFNIGAYPYFGAMTLGIGSAGYGLIMLAGTLTALGLWQDVFPPLWVMALGLAGYLVLNSLVPLPEHGWRGLTAAAGITLVYWVVWTTTVPSLRGVVLAEIVPKRRERV